MILLCSITSKYFSQNYKISRGFLTLQKLVNTATNTEKEETESQNNSLSIEYLEIKLRLTSPLPKNKKKGLLKLAKPFIISSTHPYLRHHILGWSGRTLSCHMRSISRRRSFSFMEARLSYSFFPRASAISSLAYPLSEI